MLAKETLNMKCKVSWIKICAIITKIFLVDFEWGCVKGGGEFEFILIPSCDIRYCKYICI